MSPSPAILVLALFLQEPPVDDIALAFPSPIPADRAWELADAYLRRIAENIASGDNDAARAWELHAYKSLPQGYRKVLSYARGSVSLRPAGEQSEYDKKQAVLYGLRLAGSKPFPEATILAAVGKDLAGYLATSHLVWTRACEEGVGAAIGRFAALTAGVDGPTYREGVERMLRELNELRPAGDGPEGIRKLASQLGSIGSDCPGASFVLLRRIRGLLDFEPGGEGRATLLDAGSMILKRFEDTAGAAAWQDLMFLEPKAATRNAEALLVRSNEAFKLGDFQTAESGYRKILNDWPNTASTGAALFDLGLTLQKQGRHAEARATFERLILSDVNDKEPGEGIMETYRNYRPKAVSEIAACWEAEGQWDKAIETYTTLGRKYPMTSWCGTCADSIALRSMARFARAQRMAGRYEEAFESYARAFFESDGSVSPVFTVGLVNLAVKLGRLDSVIERLKPDDPKRVDLLTHLRAIRCWDRKDADGLLKLISDRGKADMWGNFRRVDDDLESRLDLFLEVVDLAGSLGPEIIDPMLARAKSDPSLQPWVSLIIAAVRTSRSREIVAADRSDLRPRLLRISGQASRARPFDRVDVGTLDKVILRAYQKVGQSPPDDIPRDRGLPKSFWILSAIGLIAAATVAVHRIRFARLPRAG